MLAMLLTLAPAVQGQEPAVISATGNKPLRFDVLKEGAFMHTNRGYFFKQVPKSLHGLHHVLHQHKNAATVTVAVAKGGKVFLFLEGKDSPQSMKLTGVWKIEGKMVGTDAGGDRRWTIYARQVDQGERFAIRSPDKWGAVVGAAEIRGLKKAENGREMVGSRLPLVSLATPFGPLPPKYEWTELTHLLASDKADGQRHARLAREVFHPEAMLRPSDRDPLDVVLRRTTALLADMRRMDGSPDLSAEADRFQQLQQVCTATPMGDVTARKELFAKACTLRRRIAFSNPLLDFGKIVFLTHHPARRGHMVDQYFGFNARPGGGLHVLESPFGEKPEIRNLLGESSVVNGRLKGRKLEGGSFLSLELSADAKTILFAWTEGESAPDPIAWKPEWEGQGWRNAARYGSDRSPQHWAPESTYHIFRVNVDGTNLRQLTDGPWNDFDPCFLPNGRIAFISERRGGYGRCHGRPAPTYTLHSMKPDGDDIVCLSFHETNEWHPSVANDGMVVYSRWDYVDRDSDVAHHMWLTFPDGRDPRSYHGNYPIDRSARPWMELAIRAVPGSERYIGVAAAHHGQNYGSLIMIDVRAEDDRAMSQLKRITPYCPFPEAERRKRVGNARQFGTPWPLSEDYCLCVHDPAGRHYALCLVDCFGNKELLYRDPKVPCLDPIPLRSRPRPPVIPDMTRQAAGDPAEPAPRGATVAVMNVYDSDMQWPEGTKIMALRVVQLFPKATARSNDPNIGIGNQSLARGVLGTVPVEEDGSAYFEAPTGVPLYFQALDERGLAVQSMRSDTYLHPGEQLTCQGCHEPKRRQRANSRGCVPKAIRRSPSKITPEANGSFPLLFPRLVQPVLDRHCAGCHTKEKKAPNLCGTEFGKHGWSKSYSTLRKHAWAKHGGNGSIRRNGTSYSIPGKVGARAARLFRMLDKGHHDVKLPDGDMRRITLWLDCNSNFYGAYRDAGRQARGEVVVPQLR